MRLAVVARTGCTESSARPKVARRRGLSWRWSDRTGRGGGAGGLGSGFAEVEQRGGSGGAARGGVVGEWAFDATGVATAAFAGATGAAPRLLPWGAGPTPPAWVAPTERDHRRGFDSRERPGRCCGRASRRARRATETAETPRRRQPRTAETPRRRTLRERPRGPGRRPGRTLACRRARAAPRPSRLRSRYLLDIPSHPLRSSPATARPLPKRGSHAQPPSRGRVATLWRN